MKKKICLISDHHLCINPRLWKEAFVYEKMGFEVTILTKWQSKEHKQRDLELLKGCSISYLCYLNITPGEVTPAKRFYYRLRTRVASEMQVYFKIGGKWAINHDPGLLFKKALELNADLYSAHLESGFYAGRKLIKAEKKVCFDFEDWYSKDYLTSSRAKGLLKKLEIFALNYGNFCTVASNSMAVALKNTYQFKNTVEVIYNSFPDDDFSIPLNNDSTNSSIQVVWTSRTVGPGRGLETFLESLAFVRIPLHFHIIGECQKGYEQFLQNEFSKNEFHKLFFHGFLSHSELQRSLHRFDLGLAIENNYPENRDVTVTNKILQYLQFGLSVLATNTKGQEEISAFFPDSITTVDPLKTQDWAFAIENFYHNRKIKDQRKHKLIYQANFSWHRQEEKLKNLIDNYL
jgi:hypothetical protein